MRFVLPFFVVGLVSTQVYFPETIDSLNAGQSSHERVSVAGTVLNVTMTQDKTVTFRLRDAHGHSIGCLFPSKANPSLPQPRVGAEIVVYGVRHAFVVPHQDNRTVTEIDPVEKIEPVE